MHSSKGIFHNIISREYFPYDDGCLLRQSLDNIDMVQRLQVDTKLKVHNGCVNTICWNDKGTLLLSGSDDQHILITDPFTNKIKVKFRTAHRANIFSAKFLPNTGDQKVVSCSGDGMVCYNVLDREESSRFDCHYGTTYKVATVPQDSHSFLTCGEDCTVRWFDLRIKTSCNKSNCKQDILISCNSAVAALDVNPVKPYELALGCADSNVRIYDRRMLSTAMSGGTGYTTGSNLAALLRRFSAPGLGSASHRITSVSYNSTGEELLVSYSSEQLYLFSLVEFEDKTVTTSTQKCTKPAPQEPVADISSPPSTSTGPSSSSSVPPVPPVKRVRLRGDWSDTGPQARPESERTEAEQDTTAVTVMRRMSDMCTRWLELRSRDDDTSTDDPENPSTSRDAIPEEDEPTGDAGSENPEGAGESMTTGRSSLDQTGNAEVTETADSLSDNRGSVEETECAMDTEVGTVLEDSATNVDKDTSSEISTENKVSSTSVSSFHTAPERISEDKVQPSEGTLQSTSTQSTSTQSTSSFTTCQSSSLIEPKGTSQTTENSESENSERNVSEEAYSRLGSLSSDLLSIQQTVRTTGCEPVVSLTYSTEGTIASEVTMSLPNMPSVPSEMPSVPSSVPCVPSNMQSEPPSTSSLPSDVQSVPSCVSNDNVPDTCPSKNSDKKTEYSDKDTKDENLSSPNNSVILPEKDSSVITCDSACPSENTGNQTEKASEITIDAYATESSGNNNESANNTCPDQVSVTSGPGTSDSVDNRNDGKCKLKDTGSESPDSQGFTPMDTNDCDKLTSPSICVDGSNVDENTPSTLRETSTEIPGTSGAINYKPGTSGATNCEMSLADRFDNDFSDDKPSSSQANRNESDVTENSSKDVTVAGDGEDNENSDSSETDTGSDSSTTEVARRRIHRGLQLDRNRAAIKLQQLFRKRKESREGPEMPTYNDNLQPKVKMVFQGHRNSRTMIKEASFWGDAYIMSGSDCGHVFIWEKKSGRLLKLLEGDKHVVNCLKPHPHLYLLATSGIDYDIKLWTPTAESAVFDQVRAEEVIRRNTVMLKETRDTITVPASFMLRMLASLNRFRNVQQSAAPGSSSDDSDED